MFVKGLAEVKFRISFLINSCIDMEDKFEELVGLVLFDAYSLITCEADTRPVGDSLVVAAEFLVRCLLFLFLLRFSFPRCCGNSKLLATWWMMIYQALCDSQIEPDAFKEDIKVHFQISLINWAGLNKV